ncbi:hypothetical protein OIE49_29510 [Streptomyces sp. NBC_01788]|uniref:hypothetical protein n=1 Tax=Streptomyces sp. NBC_01788 TaxID=2975940 RepID=UPI002DD846CF|nr:hypothetical protein [Streptomyces sp. NBC_01788]WSB29692.1 hypothetical protein OIE49_29510 [Streptomyces sp. NBC_01788]
MTVLTTPRTHTVRRRDRRTGRFVKTFTLTYSDKDGTHTRRLPARGIETVGRIISRHAERGEAWAIAVHDSSGDVTFDFACFT